MLISKTHHHLYTSISREINCSLEPKVIYIYMMIPDDGSEGTEE
jgi:hypothetical protein